MKTNPKKDTFTWPDGSEYEGGWQDGLPHGQGAYTWPSGSTYVGEFKDGKEHGQGTYTHPNGKQDVGEFRDGKPWNGTRYDKHGNVEHTASNGVWLTK